MQRRCTRTLPPTSSRLGLSAAVVRLERRNSQRLAMRMPVKYRLLGSGQSWRSAICRDLGGNGALLSINESLHGSPVLEVLLFPEHAEPLEITCQVRWRKRLPHGTMHVRMMLLAINEPQRFVEFFCEQLLERGLAQSMPNEPRVPQGVHLELRAP